MIFTDEYIFPIASEKYGVTIHLLHCSLHHIYMSCPHYYHPIDDGDLLHGGRRAPGKFHVWVGVPARKAILHADHIVYRELIPGVLAELFAAHLH